MKDDIVCQFDLDNTTYIYTYNNDFALLYKLKQSGKRLKELLNITEEDIDRAIKELRRDW